MSRDTPVSDVARHNIAMNEHTEREYRARPGRDQPTCLLVRIAVGAVRWSGGCLPAARRAALLR